MPDNIELNLGAGGEILATDLISGAQHQKIKVEFGADGTATEVKPITPLPIDRVPNSPRTTHALSVSLGAGATASLDSDQISSGLTGKLIGVWVHSSVFLKAELFTVQNATPSAVLATWFPSPWLGDKEIPARGYVDQAEDAGVGFDGFRIDVTNLDPSEAADVYATFFFDEE